MADPADPSKPRERYAAIEQAYCADQWGEVIDQGQSLLRELPGTAAPLPEGLKERLQLLMAHAHLYGFHQRQVAADLYREVLHSNVEPALRQIAEEGLQQCAPPPPMSPALSGAGQAEARSPGPAATATAAAPSPTASPQPPAPSSAATSSPAMPWLASGARATPEASAAASAAPTPWATAATRPDPPQPAPSPEGLKPAPTPPPEAAPQEALIPEVVEEPELVEIHQADPLLAEELDLTVLAPEPPVAVTAAEIGELPNTSLAAAAAIASAAILEATAAAAETPTGSARQEQGWEPERQPQAPPGPLGRAAPGKPQSLLSLAADDSRATPQAEALCELFRHPPAPLEEEEDQDLLLGLLRVVVRADSAGDGG